MRSTVIKLVAFVTMCSIIAGYLVFTIGNVQSLRIGPVQFLSDTYKVSAVFDDVTGLLPNDNVKVAGVVVGKVTGVKVLDGKALVNFRIKSSTKVPSDTSAAIRWRNLLGQRYLYLYPGTASTVLTSGARIKNTVSVVDLGELFNRLGPIVSAIDPSKVNAFLDTIVGALDGNEEKVNKAIDDLAAVAATLGDRDAAIGRLVDNLNTVSGAVADRDVQIRLVLDNLVAVAKTFNENTSVLDNAVTQLGDFTGHLSAILTNNRTEIDRIVTNLAAVVAVVQAKLPTLDHAVSGLDDVALRLNNASQYGEWLNQTIPCGRVGYPVAVSVSTPCTPVPTSNSAGAFGARSTRGAAAIRALMLPQAAR